MMAQGGFVSAINDIADPTWIWCLNSSDFVRIHQCHREENPGLTD